MSKKHRSKKGQPLPTSARFPWLWGIVGVALLLVTGGLLLVWTSSTPSAESGTPQLVVDQVAVDEGYQTYNTPVRTTFRLRNEGDGPLHIVSEPVVELVEGC